MFCADGAIPGGRSSLRGGCAGVMLVSLGYGMLWRTVLTWRMSWAQLPLGAGGLQSSGGGGLGPGLGFGTGLPASTGLGPSAPTGSNLNGGLGGCLGGGCLGGSGIGGGAFGGGSGGLGGGGGGFGLGSGSGSGGFGGGLGAGGLGGGLAGSMGGLGAPPLPLSGGGALGGGLGLGASAGFGGSPATSFGGLGNQPGSTANAVPGFGALAGMGGDSPLAGGASSPSPMFSKLPSDPSTLHQAFHYADIAAFLLQPPAPHSIQDCRELCQRNESCAAWEVCAPLGDGCDGCYLVSRAPRRWDQRQGWHAEILPGREELGWNAESEFSPANLTQEGCKAFLLQANGADQSVPFHEPAIMQKYAACGSLIWEGEQDRDLTVVGQHWPTFVVTHFREPPILLPQDVEREMLASAPRAPRTPSPLAAAALAAAERPGVTSQLHGTIGSQNWEDRKNKARAPHAFLLPFYDTNIGHWMKQHGSMNPLQSYEMQSLLQPGDTVIDVGANLGCYTVPFAERVGIAGKVISFEPFRWLRQVVAANVALNGLSNVWLPPVGLSTSRGSFEARPPQLKFFSSPGGMKLQQQQQDAKPEEVMQLYDWDSAPERITVLSLDEVLGLVPSPGVELLGLPQVDDVRLIKIDVEGMEKEVLAGARRVVQAFKPIVWTENVAYFSSNGQDVSFLQIMDEMEYACAQAQNAPNDIICTDRHGRGHQIV
ncbi:hypothetical protein AK812_SmicGene31336 [Symbiodinium microadriaticum]|uniref:Methyltransferase FkbM domain-containing protein n=1 Tax=Symbiodinium microadriaticum TaxID=2951 RepID=A0A1Q9CWX6_SYMMI|nr:hypothetical protein AK812_SmicGene31336 [Symbiodinium microadriaticum]